MIGKGMKVVILAGGFGTRFGRATDFMPKPMIPVGPMPILWHLMRYYASFGHNEFILATGYKSELIKEFFTNLNVYSQDFTCDFSKPEAPMKFHAEGSTFQPKVTVAYTGQDTMTGARVKRVARYLGNDESFLLTYGDGLTNVDINDLIRFHQSHGKQATLTAVHPPPKFGNLQFEGDRVTSFTEKEGKEGGLVNGGFYVLQREVLDYLSEDPTCVLEKGPMIKLASTGELMAYRHSGYWQCMDTTRDMELLKEVWDSGKAPWKRWADGYVD
jgi:glucose-1-phosphate cytidylyltransferase